MMLIINENPVGIYKPIKFKTKAGFCKIFKKITRNENPKIIKEYDKTIFRAQAELLI